MSYKMRTFGTLIVAFFLLIIAISFWLYGQGSNRYIDALLVGLGALIFFALSIYMYKQRQKRNL